MADRRPGAAIRALAAVWLCSWAWVAGAVAAQLAWEARRGGVAVAADLPALAAALADERALDRALARLRAAGVPALAVPEATPARLRRLGLAAVVAGRPRGHGPGPSGARPPGPPAAGGPRAGWTHVRVPEGPVAAWLLRACGRLGPGACAVTREADILTWAWPFGRDRWDQVGLGILPADAGRARRHGFDLLPVLPPVLGWGPAEVDGALRELTGQGRLVGVLLAGPAVPGLGPALGRVADWLVAQGLTVGVGAPQEGLGELLRRTGYRAARVHVSGAEGPEAVEGTLRAVEREGVRFVVLRPPPGPDGVDRMVREAGRLVWALRSRGWLLGPASPSVRPPVPGLAAALLAGTAAAGVLFLARLLRAGGPVWVAAWALSVGGVGLWAWGGSAGRLTSWAVAALLVLAPAWAADASLRRWARRARGGVPAGATAGALALDAGAAAAVAGLGILGLAGALADPLYGLGLAALPAALPAAVAGSLLGPAVAAWRGLGGWPRVGSIHPLPPREAARRLAWAVARGRRAAGRWRHAVACLLAAVAGLPTAAALGERGLGVLAAALPAAAAVGGAVAARGNAGAIAPAAAGVAAGAAAGMLLAARPGVDAGARLGPPLGALGAGLAATWALLALAGALGAVRRWRTRG